MLDTLFQNFDKLVILDVETTGLDCRKDEVIEIAALRISSGSGIYHVECELDSLIRLSDGKNLPNVITRLTGITEQMLFENGDPRDKVCKEIVEILNIPKTLLVAYNAQFDLCFLYYLLLKYNYTDVLKKIKMLDAMTIYKDRRDYPHRLSDAIAAYNLEYQNSHRAIADAKAALAVLAAMAQEQDDLYRYVNLFGYNPKYGVSGPKISSVKYLPQGYNRNGRLYE
jgi:DNA polymerase-3 subunit epsilon